MRPSSNPTSRSSRTRLELEAEILEVESRAKIERKQKDGFATKTQRDEKTNGT